MFGVPRPRESGDLWGKNSFFPFFYAWFLFSRDENGSYFCSTIFSFCPFLRVVLIFAGTKWFIFSRPHQKRENMNTRSLETRKWGPREKMDVYSIAEALALIENAIFCAKTVFSQKSQIFRGKKTKNCGLQSSLDVKNRVFFSPPLFLPIRRRAVIFLSTIKNIFSGLATEQSWTITVAPTEVKTMKYCKLFPKNV